ncbi:MAG TPA: hypothetical protein VGF17_20125 [Phytomonospora sp.]
MGARRRTSHQIANPQGGRKPRLLEPEVRKTIIDAIALGVPVTIACQGAGIAEQSYRNWLNRGCAEHEARADDTYEPDPAEDLYVDFYLEVQQSRSQAAFRNVGIIQKVAQGGTVTERTVETYTDREGNEVTKETVKRQAPDWRAASWYLERAHRSEYGKDAAVVEISGPGGGPVEFTSPEEELAHRLTEFIAAQQTLELAASDTTDDEVHDAELVESAE